MPSYGTGVFGQASLTGVAGLLGRLGRLNWPGVGATIRDMTSVPDRARVRLTGISSRAYEHPADRSALVALRKLTGFDTLLRKLFGLFNERAFRLMYLAGAVRASERQFPHIYELVRDGSYVLDLPDVPEVYVTDLPFQAVTVHDQLTWLHRLLRSTQRIALRVRAMTKIAVPR